MKIEFNVLSDISKQGWGQVSTPFICFFWSDWQGGRDYCLALTLFVVTFELWFKTSNYGKDS